MSVKIELRITVSNEGEIRVYGPVQDKILCFGLLEMAKDAIRDHKVEKSDILVPDLTLVPRNL